MENNKISRVQADKFKVLGNERRALKFILDEVMDNMLTRKMENQRLHDAVWEEIIEQFDLDKGKVWEVIKGNEVTEKVGRGRKKTGFYDTMEDEKDEKDTSS